MAKRICAFIDLLGFSNHIKDNSESASHMLDNYQQIIFNKIAEKKFNSRMVTTAFSINNTSENSSVDSFKEFIPFSDSIFITSDEFDIFIPQLSNFLFESFDLSSSLFANPKNKEEPTKYTILKNIADREGKIVQSEFEQIAFPVLFRGGIAYDEVADINTNYIFKRENQLMNSITGMGIVKAVELGEKFIKEKSIKGPRLFCHRDFIEKLHNDVKRWYISPIEESDVIFELLWPISQFPQNGDPDYEIMDFDGLFYPALNLWRAYNHEAFGIHYYKFMKLIIKSTLRYFKEKRYENESVNYIIEILIREDLKIKIQDLIFSKYV